MPCDTYLAKDILALDTLAKKSIETMRNMKLQQAYKAAEKLNNCINANLMDEEKTYIHITRYLLMLDYIYKHEKDEKFLKLRYDSMRQEFQQKHLELRANLINRYQAFENILTPTKPEMKIESVTVFESKEKPIFGFDKYVTCQQLYEANNIHTNMLIIDVRSRKEYENSHLKEFNIINIDESLIVPGLSANKLREKLPNDIKENYDRRDTFDYIVLLDFDTTQDTYMTSRLRTLYTIFTEWDLNTIYKHSPYILKGGYIDFVDRYPTYSTNPNVILRHKYEELDELLDLDIIQYPDEFSTVKEEADRINLEMDRLYEDILDITHQLLAVEEGLLLVKSQFYNSTIPDTKKRLENEALDAMKFKSDLQNMKKSLQSKMQTLLHKKPRDNIRKKAEIRDVEYKIVNISRELRKLAEVYRDVPVSEPVSEPMSMPSSSKIIAPIGDKPSISPTVIEVPKPMVPVVNRSTKPRATRRTQNLGLVGLTNIRNTCYMNSIIQCFRHLPCIKDYFLSGEYENGVTAEEPALIYETADLIKKLWTTTAKSITPREFYKKVVALNPTFRRGNHEDANEFFMYMYDRISEDTCKQLARDKYAEAKFQTFCDRIQYKISFLDRQFYHQIRTDCVCGGCGKKCLKYDIENVLIMAVPKKGSCSIEEMFDEFMCTCDISDFHCRDCERKSDIIREFSYQPKIMAFLLKRYSYDKGVADKITIPCDFPIENFRMGRAVYKLRAASLHQGGIYAGHYTAVCLNPENGMWYEFNDESVRPININSRMIKERMYMLFYESEDGSEVGFKDTPPFLSM